MRKLLALGMLLCCTLSVAADKPAIRTVLLVVAMQQEAEPIISALKLHPSIAPFHGLPMQVYTGKFSALQIVLLLNGQDAIHKVDNIGSQPATLTTYLGIEHFHPDLIISIGTAGGMAGNQAQAGNIVVSKKIYFYARRMPLPGYYDYGIGGYSSWPIKNNPQFKLGTVCSGDTMDQDPSDYKMYVKYHCDAIEMEAAAVAWVSSLKHIPMVAIKGVTNDVQVKTAVQDFDKNFSFVTKKLALVLVDVLNSLSK